MIEDPLDKFFGVSLPKAKSPPKLSPPAEALAASSISEALVAEDLRLVRDQYKSAIRETGGRIEDVISLAIQTQEPDMVRAAAAFLTAFSKISRDLIEIDLACLNKTAKTVQVPTTTSIQGEAYEVTVTEATTAEVMRLFKQSRNATAEDVNPREPIDDNITAT